ncbi:hypothetical protein QF046_003544 [Microbacterium sp. W4I4]|uniref:hypothetical protein n=1 Tax=Microbacterium sp. W4I4 TaxID=3042295 RepID=UPI00278564A6|nr:hypothetical protein [Microbacterium sp. W4I4]MDQ0615903.1 hypothetical protein [Microbacterium sp. W4I4]
MSEKVHPLYILPDEGESRSAVPSEAGRRRWTARGLDRVLAVQRPLVVAHIRSIRLRHPHATTQQIVAILETRYLAAVTTGGAAVGATAVIPGIGTGITLALSGAETVGFMESTALFAQSVAEVHGIAIEDPERARALVMALMLGKEGVDLVSQLTKQATGKGGTRSSYWGELVTKSLPRAAMGPLVDRLKSEFIRQFASRGGASFIGKAMPFGVGAVIGGAGNHLLGRRVLNNSRRAFGAAPAWLPKELEPVPGSEKLEWRMLHGARLLGSNVTSRLRRRKPDVVGEVDSSSTSEN